jgi:hypothetical protein
MTENKLYIDLPKQIMWKDTRNFKGNIYCIYLWLEEIAGEKVFGKGRCKKKEAILSVTSYLKKSTSMNIYSRVEGGTIIKTPPTKDDCVNKLVELGIRSLLYYSNLQHEQIEVTDNWARDAFVSYGSPLNKSVATHYRVLGRSSKRFTGKKITPVEKTIDIIKSSKGLLSEGYVVAFLNTELNCPECQVIGKIGWCDCFSNLSVDSFRDAICMNCLNNNVVTLFEIKTRWEKAILNDGISTYAGSFIAINTLMTIKANMYLVVVGRDSGTVRIGKITSAKMRGNHNWQYALQEGLKWGSPSSFVTCADGLYEFPSKMTTRLLDIFTTVFIEEVTTRALNILKELKKI